MAERIALVSGGNRGIGYGICRGLAEAGLTVYLGARSPADREQAAQTLRAAGEIRPIALDVADETSIHAAIDRILREQGRLDALVNNAGTYPDRDNSILTLDIAVLRRTFEVNFFGAFLLCQRAIPIMRQQRYGRVVNVSSDMGAIGSLGPSGSAYKLSKLSLNMMTRAFAASCSSDNVKVNTMSPGWVKTDMGGSGAPRSVEQGADTAIWLATLPDTGPTGGFFRDRQSIAW